MVKCENIRHLLNRAINGRGRRNHRQQKQHQNVSERQSESDKPPTVITYPDRNAKSVLCLSKGGFGFFHHAVRARISCSSTVGCRSPPCSICVPKNKDLNTEVKNV